MVSDQLSPNPVYVVGCPRTIGEKLQWYDKINEEYGAAVQRGYKSTKYIAMKKLHKSITETCQLKNIKFD